MKSTNALSTLVLLIAIVFLTSCSKGTSTNPTPAPAKKTPEQLLDSGKWVISNISFYDGGGAMTNAIGQGTFVFLSHPLDQFTLSVFTFSNAGGAGNGTVIIDNYAAGGTYYFQQTGESLDIFFNNMNGFGIGGTISVSSTKLILDMPNEPIEYIQGNYGYQHLGFKETLTH